MTALLITQCLQNDFVKPLSQSEPLPNLLHIGPDESQRLMGENPQTGPIGHFMQWAQENAIKQQFNIIHIRDWHDSNCPKQQKHLKQFGLHCLANSVGAQFAFEAFEENTTVINSTTLNDFENTQLQVDLDKYRGQRIRVGLIGVWTEAKILFLAYELATRYPEFDIAVCSALTASSSRSQHFLAIEQLKNIIGVKIINSVGEFAQFLTKENPENNALGTQLFGAVSLSMASKTELVFSDAVNLTREDEQLIRYLFRDCKKIQLKVLDGGFSGNFVAGVKSIDIQGQEQAQHVIKLGPRDLMARERIAFEQIEPILGNNAPAINGYADLNTRGGIKYRYASMGEGKTSTLQELIQDANTANSKEIKQHLNIVFREQLGKLYRAAVSDKYNLFEYYCFNSKWASSIKEKIIELIDTCPDTEELNLPGNRRCPNLYYFYKNELENIQPLIDDFPFSFIHGDLNGANIIVDSGKNIWVIDFFHTHKGHAIKDFCKLDNDLYYICTPIDSKEELQLAFDFTDFILKSESPLNLNQALPNKFRHTQFELCYELSRHIRELGNNVMLKEYRHQKAQWLIAQLRYAVHTIGFDEPNKLQRIWALYTSCQCAKLLKQIL